MYVQNCQKRYKISLIIRVTLLVSEPFIISYAEDGNDFADELAKLYLLSPLDITNQL